jgi:DNA-binding MarR family transcriptional regulator
MTRTAQIVQDDTADTADTCASALHADLGWTLGTVFRAYLKATDAVMADLPGAHRGYQILTTAVRAVPATQLSIAQRLGVDRTVMTYLLDDLERAGLIERRPDPADRRARHIVATDQGRSTLAELALRLRDVEEHVLVCLDEAERATVRTLLRRLALHADARDPVADTCQLVADTNARPEPAAASPTQQPARRARRGRAR